MPKTVRKNRRSKKQKATARKSPANRRAAKTEREKKQQKLQARNVGTAAQTPIEIPPTWIKNFVGLFLLPLCVISTITFFTSFASAALEGAFWRTPEFWFFNLGVVLWLIAFWGLPRPVRLYVFGHEMTHALFVYFCGGRVEEFKVTGKGGHVVTDKNNLLISLAPYFIPFYTVLAVLAFILLGAFFDLSHYYEGVFFGIGGFKWVWLMFGIIGLTWGFHLAFTIWMITKDQPDLRIHGTFFSLMLIYLVNVFLISGLLVIASPSISFGEFASSWGNTAQTARGWVSEKLRLLVH